MMKHSGIRGGIPVNKRELGDYTETEFLYFSECREKFLGDDVVERGMISQEKFADAYSTSCVKFYSEGNSCPGPNFSMFPESLQTVFYGAACKSMSDPSACGMNLNSLPMKIGYIVSRDEMSDVQMHVEGMCLGMMDQVFHPPSLNLPIEIDQSSVLVPGDLDQPSIGPGSSIGESVSVNPETAPPQSHETEEILDLTAIDQNEFPSNSPDKKSVATPNSTSSHAPLIGIVVLASACLLLVAFVIYRRRRASLADKSTKDSCSQSTSIEPMDLEAPVQKSRALVVKSPAKNGRGFTFIPTNVTGDHVEEAIDNANWDLVYVLASRLAEYGDLSTDSRNGRKTSLKTPERIERRSYLDEEDHERAKTFDVLISNADWTGVAVTAALYAGEGRKHSEPRTYSSSSQLANGQYNQNEQALLQLKKTIDNAVAAGDWETVAHVSSEIENHSEYKPKAGEARCTVAIDMSPTKDSKQEIDDISYETLQEEMDSAIARGDWASVAVCAEKIHSSKLAGHGLGNLRSTSKALVPLTRPPPTSGKIGSGPVN